MEQEYEKEKERGENNGKKAENICYRCGSKGHWTRASYTLKHLVELYQESLKKKNIETHFAYEDGDSDYGHMDTTHLDIGDFFSKPDGSIDHLIGDGSVRK